MVKVQATIELSQSVNIAYGVLESKPQSAESVLQLTALYTNSDKGISNRFTLPITHTHRRLQKPQASHTKAPGFTPSPTTKPPQPTKTEYL
jgi:hypothetical protein